MRKIAVPKVLQNSMVKKTPPDHSDHSTRAVKPVVAGKKNLASKSAKTTSHTDKSKPRADKPAANRAERRSDAARSAKPYGSEKPPAKPAPKRKDVAPKAELADVPDAASPTDEKLQKVLARAGMGSRREMERAIEAGQVKVNDRVATLGDRVTPQDKIFVNGQRVILRAEATRRRVILYNKPEGEICSRSDPEGRPTVYAHLPPLSGERWISVGRLDFNTSGLLLFTNDGELANKLMHPSSVIDREYLVRIQGDVTDEMKQNLIEGVALDDGVARFTDIVDGAGESRNRWFYCVVMEGRNREVRRLWESQGVKVSRLKRVRYANIFIPSHVRVGQWIELSEKEIHDLCMTAGFDSSNYTRIMEPSRDDKIKQDRHDKKLRSASSPPKRIKAPARKRPPIV
jgi:23S rRNA pseudouridine2605 synthase